MLTTAGHVTYCTNIHSGESWKDHFAEIQLHFPGIKAALSPEKPMGIGLRLSNAASVELMQDNNLAAFKQWLDDNEAYVFTMNGFPYGAFHRAEVKDQVHSPDWTSSQRLIYTLRMFGILAQLLPEGMEGGISTSPLSYRYWFDGPHKLASATKTATENILKIAEYLIDLASSTGKILHLDIEPEPDGILENGPEFIAWYESDLLPAGIPLITAKYAVSPEEAEILIKAHICLCYDVCHFAIGYEPHADIIKTLKEKGIRIGKIQVSAALKAMMVEDLLARTAVTAAFAKFNESVYLHQVVAKTENGGLLRYRDLPEALLDAGNISVVEWRAHFHVPIFEKNPGLLQSTQDDILEVIALHRKEPITRHLEVETYTWEVLPEELKAPVGQSIIRELKWVLEKLEQ